MRVLNMYNFYFIVVLYFWEFTKCYDKDNFETLNLKFTVLY